MNWKGLAIGACIGGIIGRSPLGIVFGALIGHQIAQRIAFTRRRGREAGRAGGVRRGQSPLSKAYATLGARPTDSAQKLTRKYRELAKRHHPDAMRARGASEDAIAKATERMSRINAAWAEIRSARGI